MARSVLNWALVFVIGALLVLNVAFARGDDEEAKEDSDHTKTDDEEIDPDALRAASDIVTTVYFPEFPDKKFPIGVDVVALVGVANRGKEDYNMSYIGASLHNPFDLHYHIQNFTWRVADGTVEAGTEQTFEYLFRPDARLEPLTFWLTAFIGYNNTDTGVPYQSTVHNTTVELIERASDANGRRVFVYFLALAAAGLVGYFVYNSATPKSRATERGTRDDGQSGSAASSWVPAKVYSQSKQAKVVGRKGAGAGKPKAAGPASPKAADS